MTSISVSTAISSGRVQLVNVRQRLLLTAHLRTLWVLGLFALVAFAAIVRVIQLGLFEDALEQQSLRKASICSRLRPVFSWMRPIS